MHAAPAVQLLHGITYACGWGAGTVTCKQLAPPGLEATMQVGRRAAATHEACIRHHACAVTATWSSHRT
jgi:hypothetical protein